jgi:hypothetical protein
MTSFTSKNAQKFICNNCDFTCCKKGDWSRHLLTAKHKKATEATETENRQKPTNENKIQMHECSGCGREYSDRTGLWRHRKKCLSGDEPNQILEDSHCKTSGFIQTDLVSILLNQNQEFKELIIEQNKVNQKLHEKILEIAKEGKTINNTNTFNLQFFLNEQCKDALNITDFINQLQLKISDLDMVGRVGYSEGISKIFIRGLKELDVSKRPIHCCDFKREVLYVKDKDAWEKDNQEKEKMKTAIRHIAAKNFKQINNWKEENPDSDDYESKKHMEYHNIIINASGGVNDEEDEKNYNKIIKNVTKEVVIDKDSK